MRDIPRDHGAFGLNWGYASSPLLHRNALFVQVLHGMKTDDPSYLLRIDGDTGDTVWRQERPTEAVRESPDFVHDPGAAAVRRDRGDRHHGWRCRDRARPGDWARTLARRWVESAAQPFVSDRGIAGGAGTT